MRDRYNFFGHYPSSLDNEYVLIFNVYLKFFPNSIGMHSWEEDPDFRKLGSELMKCLRFKMSIVAAPPALNPSPYYGFSTDEEIFKNPDEVTKRKKQYEESIEKYLQIVTEQLNQILLETMNDYLTLPSHEEGQNKLNIIFSYAINAEQVCKKKTKESPAYVLVLQFIRDHQEQLNKIFGSEFSLTKLLLYKFLEVKETKIHIELEQPKQKLVDDGAGIGANEDEDNSERKSLLESSNYRTF